MIEMTITLKLTILRCKSSGVSLSSFSVHIEKTRPPPRDMTAADREDLLGKAALAESTFRASFRNKLDDNPEVLSTLPLENAIDIMMGWVGQTLPGLVRTQENSIMQESFSDINQCSNRLKFLASETDGRDQTCSWPFIRKLKFV